MVVFVFVIVVVLAGVVLTVAGARVIAARRRKERDARTRFFPLIYPLPPSMPAGPPLPPRMQWPKRPSDGQEEPAQVTAPPLRGRPEEEPEVDASGPPDTSPTVRFRRPADDAVELLPGRLEVLAGEPHHKEIRFVRAPGERPEVVLGRDVGDGPGHVALKSKTVSRRHARLAYDNGQWLVANLSQTNPVVVNEETLLAGNGERPLTDGDCLELGEVVLRFHAR